MEALGLLGMQGSNNKELDNIELMSEVKNYFFLTILVLLFCLWFFKIPDKTVTTALHTSIGQG